MKRIVLTLFTLILIVTSCTSKPPETVGAVLKVTDGTVEKNYTADDLKALGASQVVLNDVTYVGVTLKVLLQDAGIDPTGLSAVKAVAVDGFTANYDSSLFMREDTLVAYARVDGSLAEDEMPFRMVLPDQGGKLNPRQITEIIAIP
ncbi:MAG: molybdopterin-dependent oxidoreductase [Chloroflexota bacterium]